MSTLSRDLERLCAGRARRAHLARDPIRFPRRYQHRPDVEVAAVLASTLAYGRVDLFAPVVERILDLADAHGGPARLATRFDPELYASALRPLVYRWTRGRDVMALLCALGEPLRRYGSLEPLTGGVQPGEADAVPALERLVQALRGACLRAAPRVGIDAGSFSELPRGLRMMLCAPSGGSACKRWWMFLRWMCRPPSDGVDLGLWCSIPPRHLLLPLDTHVFRISGLLGLSQRRQPDLRAAREITAALRRFDPEDPVRFDFALAHLGISESCRGRWIEEVCGPCAIQGSCSVVAASSTEPDD